MTNTIKISLALVTALLALLSGYALGFNQAQTMWENKIKLELCK